MIHIWTDGSSRGNPGLGGYGVVVFDNDNITYAYHEQFNDVTNNKMELSAILHALEIADKLYPEETCIVHTDSMYCTNICNDWMFLWARNDWIRVNKQPIENLDLIQSIYKYFSKDFYHCQVKWDKSHCGTPGNEIADALATFNEEKFYEVVKENGISVSCREI